MRFDLPDGWKRAELGEVCESISNTHKSIKEKMVLINTSDILEGKVNNHTYANTENMAGQFKKSIQPNDILYSEIRPNNKRYALIDFVANDYICSTKLMVIRGNSKISTKFLYLYLTSSDVLNILQEQAEGRSGTFPQITFNNVANLELSLPPLPEQHAIAGTLSCLDDKIELNNRINKTLEEMAQAIFKRWFVDFEFPNEDGQPYRSSGGAMQDSELGKIPQGWRVGNVDEYFKISIGKTPPRKEPQWFTQNKNDIKWLSIADIGRSGMYILDTSEYLTNEAVYKHNVKIVPKGTVVLSFKLTIGRVAITNECITTNEAIAHFVTDKKQLREYTCLYLKQFNYESLGNTSSIATAVNSKTIKSMPFLMPSEYTLKAFHKFTLNLFELIRKNEQQNQTLTAIRDTLLPKLMSGEIRIPLSDNQN